LNEILSMEEDDAEVASIAGVMVTLLAGAADSL
jgi:hypothetical protein